VRDRDFRLRPIGSVADILRVTPALSLPSSSCSMPEAERPISTSSRGVDADHGTDIALSVDGIPINMVSHAHGQGYSDSNFVIPEIDEGTTGASGATRPYGAEL